ncbi:MAG: TrmH family RNA methyltransferase [Leptospiraceae bacterium]|nr:TrmH family RNA methyltransferase [Leptospiraceae bacterium]
MEFKFRILLENPKYSGNIGMICRLIANFDLPALRILGERRTHQFEMEWMAHNATHELDSIEYCDNFEDLSSGLDLVIGTGMIHGKDRGRYIGFSELEKKISGNNVGILFGREDIGIRKETMILCDSILDFELTGKQKSMNLASSVAFVLGNLNQTKEKFIAIEPISGSEKKKFYELAKEIFQKLEMNEFHGNENLATKRFKTILEERNISEGDYRFLFKMLKNIEKKIND